MKKEQKFVIVDADTQEIYVNKFDGDLPPMTEQEIKNYFYNSNIEEIKKENRVKFYPVFDTHRCKHCGAPLAFSETAGYAYQCFYCNEDFYEIETIVKNIDEKIAEFQNIENGLRMELLKMLNGVKNISLGLENGDYVDIQEIKHRDIILTDGTTLNITTKELIDLYYIAKNKNKK